MEKAQTHFYFYRGFALLAAFVVGFLFTGCGTIHDTYRGELQAAGHFDTVVLDPGHGGHDLGAKGKRGVPEKALALDTSRRAASILRSAGINVVETRSTDVFIPLDRRVQFSNGRRDSVFVSIHYNWTRRSKARGVETFFYGQRASRLAANIQRELISARSTNDRGIKRRGFYVLRNNKRPAVLCELGFVSNPSENRDLQDPRVRQRLARAIAAGIIAEMNGRMP